MKQYIAILFCFFVTHALADNGTQPLFRKGVEAFRNGDYEQARDAFEAARERGLDTAALEYNLGVTYYRLNDYSAAEKHFGKLSQRDRWRPLALYNLGLISEKRNNADAARDYYRQARDTGDARVAGLAGEALQRLVSDQPQGQLFLSMSLGHDSNITLSPDSLDESTDQSDHFLEAYVTGEYPVERDWRLGGTAYLRRFADNNRFNDTLFQVELSRLHEPGRWHTRTGAQLSPAYLDDEAYQTRYGVFTEGWRSLTGDQTLKLTGEWTGVDGARAFDYLDGWQARLQARWYGPLGGTRLSLGYRLELNDRADLESGDNFLSYSPTRHRAAATLSWRSGRSWTLRGGGRYEYSEYADAHRIDGETTLRRDNQIDLFLRGIHDLQAGWQLYGEIQYQDQDSTLDTYTYERNLIQLGVEYRHH